MLLDVASTQRGRAVKKAHIVVYSKDGTATPMFGFKAVSEFTNLPVPTISTLMLQGRASKSGYSFDYEQNYVLHGNKPYVQLTFTNTVTGEVRECLGIRDACKVMGVWPNTLYIARKKGKLLDWVIKEKNKDDV